METTSSQDIVIWSVNGVNVSKGTADLQMDVLNMLDAAIEFLSIYYSMLLIITGCICNLMAVAVLSRRAFQGTSMAIYFRFLSLMDLAAILTGLTRVFQISAQGIDVRRETTSCRVNFWIMNVFLFSSSWTLVAVTTERVISIIKPHKVRIVCSPLRIHYIIIGTIISMAAMNLPIFFILGTVFENNPESNTTIVKYCTIMVKGDLVRALFWWYESTMFAFIPCIILIFFNVIILKGVIDSRRRIKKMSATTDTSKKDDKGGKQKDNKISSLTVTLLCINVTFILCNFPMCVYQVTPFFLNEWQMSRMSVVVVYFCLMLMYTNNTLNFLLYCITGSKFRTELCAMITEMFHKIGGKKSDR